MRPTPIPDDEVWPGHQRMVIGPPVGEPVHGEIRPVEMLVSIDGRPPVFSARCVLDPGDLERLAAGEPFWISLWGHVVPFDVAMTEAQQ